ncbi:hypothetical protein NC77_14310 [Janthinobacterium lividum]|uniref:hypothetical protein n=1 Tax=Janthinobacterium lividum TaxID=29581 RepID=UPI000536B8F4|nr:hypothetical protein [Janthinobacterium lividum]KHA78003.1 hypothetical protein NC77_14310 [Janthinobacterium lividum]
MKTLALLFLCATLSANLQAAEDGKDNYCIKIAATYGNALVARDAGLEPIQALGMSDFKEIPLEVRKSIINQVYFDPALAAMRDSRDLRFDLIQNCLHGPKKPPERLK